MATKSLKLKSITLLTISIVILGIGSFTFRNVHKSTNHAKILKNLEDIKEAQSQCAFATSSSAYNSKSCSLQELVNKKFLPQMPSGPIPGTYDARRNGESPTFRGRDADWWRARPHHNSL